MCIASLDWSRPKDVGYRNSLGLPYPLVRSSRRSTTTVTPRCLKWKPPPQQPGDGLPRTPPLSPQARCTCLRCRLFPRDNGRPGRPPARVARSHLVTPSSCLAERFRVTPRLEVQSLLSIKALRYHQPSSNAINRETILQCTASTCFMLKTNIQIIRFVTKQYTDRSR